LIQCGVNFVAARGARMAAAFALGAIGVFLLLWSPTAQAVICCGGGGGGDNPPTWDKWIGPAGGGFWSVDANWSDTNAIPESPGTIQSDYHVQVELDFSYGSTAAVTPPMTNRSAHLILFSGADLTRFRFKAEPL
jgi:hypothetical protein